MAARMTDANRHEEEVEGGPFSLAEIRTLRRMILDDAYRRRIRKTVKIWAYTLTSAVPLIVAGMTVWKEIIRHLWN
jgi:hypothetical protein